MKKEDVAATYSKGVSLIREFEQLRLKAYLCESKVWTIGWGTTVYPNGVKVKAGDTITKEEAESFLMLKLRSIISKLEKLPNYNSLNSNQKSALLSFAYNMGENFYGAEGFDTITRVIKYYNPSLRSQVPNAFLLYNKSNGRKSDGLDRRRKREAQLWNSDVFI